RAAAACVASPLSLHDALPIFPQYRDGGVYLPLFDLGQHASGYPSGGGGPVQGELFCLPGLADIFCYKAGYIHVDSLLTRYWMNQDRKSTRLNSSHVSISYAVF